MAPITLITGGARSGKSTHALKLAAPYARKVFLATAEARDGEMAARIAAHRRVRPADFHTIEEPVNVVAALSRIGADEIDDTDVVVLDCLTLWVANLMSIHADDGPIMAQADRLAELLLKKPFASIVVTGEVGAGVVPDNPMARRFRDLLGWTNQKIAATAAEVLMMVAGHPLKVK